MGISKLQPQSSGFDFSQATPNNLYSNIVSDTTGVGVTRNLYTRNGRGYINSILFSGNIQKAGYLQIKVDDIIIAKLGLYSTSNVTSGIILSEHLMMNGSTLYFVGYNGLVSKSTSGLIIQPYGFIAASDADNTTEGFIIIDQPIFYKKNLIIDYISDNSTSKQLLFDMQGGIY